MTREAWTLLTAIFIVSSGISLLIGFYFIRFRRDMARHRAAMLAATTLAGLFLVCYVARWAMFGAKSFEGQGWIRTAYLTNLLVHVVFAASLLPLVGRLLFLALGRKDFVAHKRLARIVFPIWLYVAASGWLVYWFLYKWTP